MAKQIFPDNFRWGVATASYQIEGAVTEDGRGPSIWDTFSHTPGKTYNGDTGDVACDHYHRWQDDVKLMQNLGINAYRFSIAWPRIIPQGTGRVNAKGLEFYDRLVDALLAASITPFVTLYHWDLPQALEDKGGWDNRDTANAFAEYAYTVARRLGDRVKDWITLNEPWVSAFLGYYVGVHAPGRQDLATAVRTAHHLLLAHGLAVPVLRDESKACRVGITLNLSPAYPATDSAADEEAAHRQDGYLNRWFLDPIFGRGYPADMSDVLGLHVPPEAEQDMAAIATPLDFLGVNYYFPEIVKAVPRSVSPLGVVGLSADEKIAAGYELTAMEWPVVPSALKELLTRIHHDYAPKAIYITENGCAYEDHLVDGKVHDAKRIAYLEGHLGAAHEAIAAGVPLRGYFLWTLMDNFEWAYGYSRRFGIVYTDYATQTRYPKDSYTFYQTVIGENGL